jgi:hypothetical protein
MPPDESRRLYESIRKSVEKRYEMRTSFFGSLAGFVIVNLLFWGLWVGPDAGWQVFRVHWMGSLITAGWAIGLTIHCINWVFTEMRENAIRQEMERFGLSYVPYAHDAHESEGEKAKRLVRLTEDGELEEVDEALSKKRRQRSS